MIRSITLCVNHSSKIRKLGLNRPRVCFESGYNALIGANGSGKSTLLNALAGCSLCDIEKTSGNEIIKYLTTETLNPLVGGSFSTREEMIQGIRALFRSHGQGVLDSLRNQVHASETVVLIDSPETGQDHQNSLMIHEGLMRMAKQFQVIVATNSLVFMNGGHCIDLGRNTISRLVSATGKLLQKMNVENAPPERHRRNRKYGPDQ